MKIRGERVLLSGGDSFMSETTYSITDKVTVLQNNTTSSTTTLKVLVTEEVFIGISSAKKLVESLQHFSHSKATLSILTFNETQ